MSIVSEFYLRSNKEEIHLTILNYDVPCECSSDEEEGLTGIIIWVNDGGYYNINEDHKYYSIASFIDSQLAYFPEEFILRDNNELPVMLETYEI